MKLFLSTLYQRYSLLLLSTAFALALLALRIKVTHNGFYSFLVWNLFLAAIPYGITQFLVHFSRLRKYRISMFLAFGVWLLFLPNSPYIITDLIHLHSERSNLPWLDLFLVFVFALNGLLFGLLSLVDMHCFIQERYGSRIAQYTIFQCCILSGYGIHLGRFMRFNSWDILGKPVQLFTTITDSFYMDHVGLMTFAFGGFLWILFLGFRSMIKNPV
ncbi:DUF1361 domain-containing protein [Spongiimicrobium salis]|uniref:DUF1361 domain-containing protein n=1 Tax=Spongiimicrobium salis TaxID=1667022 RepID=UPI00374CD5CC